jgi:hypothetical protein
MTIRSGISVDLQDFSRAMRQAHYTKQDMLDVEGAGALILVNGQRMRAPVDTSALKGSIHPHVIEADADHVIDDVGAEVEYAPYIEYGTGIYAESGQGRKGGWRYRDPHGNWHFTMGGKPQPFVRPTALEDEPQVQNVILTAHLKKLQELG